MVFSADFVLIFKIRSYSTRSDLKNKSAHFSGFTAIRFRIWKWSDKVFVSRERVSGFPETEADLRGSPGNPRGSPGTSEEVWEISGKPLDRR